MSRAFNTLKASDVSTVPIKLKYQTSINSEDYSAYGIKITTGSNGPVTITGSVSQDTINFSTIRQLYYQNYLTGSLTFSASYWNSNQQSTAFSGSADFESRYFPTESNATIQVISIPPIVFGEQISRNSLSFTDDATFDTYTDDGNGNILDSNNKKAGNIIYSQGLIIITSQDLSATPKNFQIATISFLAETTIYQKEHRCHISENDFNCTQNLSAVKIGGTGSLSDNVTGSDFRPYITCVGLYNERNDLLVVGKLSTPHPIPPNTDMTFVVRYDT
jgi:hypothetical protein